MALNLQKYLVTTNILSLFVYLFFCIYLLLFFFIFAYLFMSIIASASIFHHILLFFFVYLRI